MVFIAEVLFYYGKKLILDRTYIKARLSPKRENLVNDLIIPLLKSFISVLNVYIKLNLILITDYFEEFNEAFVMRQQLLRRVIFLYELDYQNNKAFKIVRLSTSRFRN